MKRKWFIFLMASVVSLYSFPVYGASKSNEKNNPVVEEAGNTPDYFTVLSVPDKEGSQELTLEEATKLALAHSTELKSANLALELSEEKLDDVNDADVGDFNHSELISYLKQSADYANSQLSQKVKEESVKYSLKKAYIQVINAERSVALDQLNEVNLRKELEIARVKAQRGLISEQELQNQELSYQKKMTELEQKQMDIQAAYRSLYSLIGVDENANYQLSLEPVYEPLEMEQTLEGYINSKVATDLNIQQQVRNVDVAESEVAINSGVVPDTIYGNQEAENSYATAQLTLSDKKTSLRNNIRSCYDSIIALEENYENNLKELETLKKSYETTQTKYELKLCTELDLNEAKMAVAEMESTLVEQIFEHMLLLEQFENTYLL